MDEKADRYVRKGKGLLRKGDGDDPAADCGGFCPNVPVTGEKKVRVGVVGEIYVKYSPIGNNDLEEFLFSQNCETMVPGLLRLHAV
ncbi:MAG: hypothetical protein ACOX41_05050 [Anaerovoracaceae bacterium]